MENMGTSQRAPRPTHPITNARLGSIRWPGREWTHGSGYFPLSNNSSPTPSGPHDRTWSSPEVDRLRGVHTEFEQEDLQEDSDAPMEQAELRSSVTSAPASTSTSPEPTQRSRYLREADRRTIIQRIASGEKQAELAREFGVTRAAICHINKNRAEILARSTRPDVHAAARHPKRRMSAAALYQRQQRSRERYRHQVVKPHLTDVDETPSWVHRVRSRALELHMTALRRPETSSFAFRSIANRAIWILLEEALATAPTHRVEVIAPNESVWSGLAHTNSACAMVLDESGYPMLEAFRTIQPDAPTGSIALEPRYNDNQDDAPVLRKMCAPLQLRSHDVFLLSATCSRAREMCAAIQSLLDFGAHESSVCIATLELSQAAADEIHARYPLVRLVAASVDADDGATLGDFLERYFNTTTIHSSALGADADV